MLIVALAALLAAQTITADTLFVPVRATDSKKVPAAGLKAENFQLWEEGVEQKISSFSAAGGPWDINFLLLTAGGSRYGRISANEQVADRILAAYEAFQKAGNPDNKYSFDALPDTVMGDREFWPAIDQNLAALRKSRNPRRALIVVTAGFDDSFRPPARLEDVDIPIYFVFIKMPNVSDPSPDPYQGRTKGSVISEVASKTRGDYYLVTPDKVEAQLLQLAAELKNKHVIGFKPTSVAKPNSWRKLKVKVTSPTGQNLDVSIKEKYFVQKP